MSWPSRFGNLSFFFGTCLSSTMMFVPLYFFYYFVILVCTFTLALDPPLFCSVPCTLLQLTIQATIPLHHLAPDHPPLSPRSPPHPRPPHICPLLPLHHPPPLPPATLPHLLHLVPLPLDSLHNPQDFPRLPSPIGLVLCIFPRQQAQAAHLHSPPNPPIRPNPPTSQNPPPPSVHPPRPGFHKVGTKSLPPLACKRVPVALPEVTLTLSFLPLPPPRRVAATESERGHSGSVFLGLVQGGRLG